ncbi:hypothetical protein DPMN_137197 [Dreissena polymorpha]|uniref:Uncharacterized protein n=1 Tax=Dreissena polymorpha TaxID=45954 RepID=A0A9D4G1G1_DREPO|nr:hypothetical protein DPMN_137197 [Dreissena polymorpha]
MYLKMDADNSLVSPFRTHSIWGQREGKSRPASIDARKQPHNGFDKNEKRDKICQLDQRTSSGR